jgi:hypothetical protein
MNDKELDEYINRDKNNISIPIATDMIEQIRRYPDMYRSKESVLKNMFLQGCYAWKDGVLINEDRSKPDKKYSVGLEYAKRIYIFGYQNHTPNFANYSTTYSPLFNIPKDIAPEWLKVVEQFVYFINALEEKEYKLYIFNYYTKHYGLNNPNTYTLYSSSIKDFQELRKKTDQIAKDNGWDWMTLDSLHNPVKVKEHALEMSKMLNEILDEAEGFVDGAKKALQKRDAKDYIRRYGVDIFKEVIAEMETK